MRVDQDDPNEYAKEMAVDFVQWLIKEIKLDTSPTAVVKTKSKKELRSLYLQSRAAFYNKLLKKMRP